MVFNKNEQYLVLLLHAPFVCKLDLNRVGCTLFDLKCKLVVFKFHEAFIQPIQNNIVTVTFDINDLRKHILKSLGACGILEEGDMISVDCGVVMNEFYGDTAFSFQVGEVKDEIRRLLTITRECLQKGVEQAVEGKRIGDVGYAVQQHAESNGYSVVREMVGHGLGRHLHEAPEVPNYGRRGTGPKLKEGMVICIEPMINLGRRQISQEADGWTIRTADNKPSAHFEWAVAVDKGKADVLSTFDYIDKELNKLNS